MLAELETTVNSSPIHIILTCCLSEAIPWRCSLKLVYRVNIQTQLQKRFVRLLEAEVVALSPMRMRIGMLG
jgi:hypothetical protein